MQILAQVIDGLGTQKRYIPYRESRLTELLEPLLNGNAKLSMVCSFSEQERSVESIDKFYFVKNNLYSTFDFKLALLSGSLEKSTILCSSLPEFGLLDCTSGIVVHTYLYHGYAPSPSHSHYSTQIHYQACLLQDRHCTRHWNVHQRRHLLR